MRDATSPSSSPWDTSHQRLRFRRFLLASAVSALYLVVLAAFHAQDKVDSVTLFAACALVTVLVLVFLVVFRLGLNVRFSDPSLTAFQVLAAVLTMLFVVYRAPDTRIVFAAFFLVALMFAMLRSSGRELVVLGTVALAAFALVSLGRYAGNRDIEMLRLDLLQLLVMTVTFPWFVFLGRQVRRLQEADRRKDEFLATLAHELRNPLAPIRTGVEILRMTGVDSQSPAVVAMMERQLKHMVRLLDDLLDVNRITRGKIALRIERIDLVPTMQAAVEACRPLIDQMDHELTVSLPPSPAIVDADPVRLAQIVTNLLTNAARYTPRGGRIALDVKHDGREVRVSVSDNGIGIAAEKLESIFEMFTQVGSPSSQRQGGLGIGLSLAKGLVALHGGSIEVRSDGPGRGSAFHVRLPARSTRTAAAPASKRILEARRKLRILVVDDNRDAAASLSMVLQLMGHDVRTAHDGETGVQEAARFRPHVVLLDLGMPVVDGYEACRRIRATPWGRTMTLVAVTGWGQDDDRRKSSAAGFDGHFVKPVSPEMLEQLLGRVAAPA